MGKVEQLGSKVETVAIKVERLLEKVEKSPSKVESSKGIRKFRGESRTTRLERRNCRY
ncbi:hypothetical protein ABHM95_02485 [Solibacillus isronensis]|uniref:hypothetical protein n=1 Tax=Solibacillus isronensis TaxID=412383 RepID=UPI0012DE2E1F|nr:hypothetical protein [Solibacillus isronensis]